MRAIVVTEHGGPEVLELQDRPDPSPGPGELLVAVEAIGVNFRDVYEREGKGAHVSETPHPAGVEGAGTVGAVGEGVDALRARATASCGATRPAPTPSGCWSSERRGRRAAGRRRRASSRPPRSCRASTAHYLATSTYPIQEGDCGDRPRRGRRGRAAADPDRQAARRARDRDHLDRREGRARPRRGRRRDDRLRRLRRAGARADRRRGRPRGLRRDRRDDVRRVARGAAAARLHGPVRRRERAAAAGRDRGPEREVAVPHPPDAAPTTARPATSCASARASCSGGSRPASSTSGSAPATRSRTPRAPSPTSSRAAPPGS